MRRHWTLRLLWAYCLVSSVSLFRGGTCEGPPFYEQGHRGSQPGPSVGWLVRVLQGVYRLFPRPVSPLGGWASVFQGVERLFPWPVSPLGGWASVLQGVYRLFPRPVSALGGWASVLQGVETEAYFLVRLALLSS